MNRELSFDEVDVCTETCQLTRCMCVWRIFSCGGLCVYKELSVDEVDAFSETYQLTRFMCLQRVVS